jgi:two-component system, OmpR family, response regulator
VRVLIVEDEPSLREQLTRAVTDAGYVVDGAPDGARADFLARTEAYDAIVLDLGLPRIDGLRLLRGWRETGIVTPVIILTARVSWHEKVQGIDSGADDYVAKPFRVEEILARLRAVIRRATGHASPQLQCGAVTLDPRTTNVTLGHLAVRLTSHEYRVLSYLMHHRDRVVSIAELVEHIYARDGDRDSNTVEVFIARLRRKLGQAFIQTVRGMGYRVAP